MNRPATALLVASLAAAPAFSQPILDGTVDASYGAPLAVQTIQTEFGDVTDPLLPNGSELDAAYAQIVDDTLYLTFTGNLEPNFNKLAVFFDSVDGGQNNIDPLNNPAGFDSRIDPDNVDTAWPVLDDLTFDAGFEADYAMLFRRGETFDFDYAQMNQTAIVADEFSDVFAGFNSGNTLAPLPGVNHTFDLAHDDSNVAGVTGGNGPADTAAAAAVTTGTEIAIPLAALGDPTRDIKVTAFISSGSFDFLSNQFLSPLELEDFDEDPLTPDNRGNVGGFYDISVLPGDQFFTISIGGAAELAGDYNDSGSVEQGDLDLVLNNWGQARPFDPNTDPFDTTNVDQEELDRVLNNWGNSSVAPSLNGVAVPEPAMLSVLGGLAVAGLRRRRA